VTIPEGVAARRGSTMADVFFRTARRFPDRVAMVDAEGSITYRELAGRVAKVAHVLQTADVGRGDGVAQLAGNSSRAWVVQFATYALGARFVGLHERSGDDDLRFVLDDSEVSTLVVDDELHPDRVDRLLPGSAVAQVFTYGRTAHRALWDAVAAVPETEPRSIAVEDDVARLAYTGGTTGRPKGVLLTHRSLVANTLLTLSDIPWPSEMRFVTGAPITHGAGSYVLPTMIRGGTVILLDHFSVDGFLDAVEKHRVTAAQMVPTMMYDLLDHPRTRRSDLSSLELIRYGASPMAPARIEEALDVFGPILVQGYGQTEAPNTISVLLPSDHVTGSPRLGSVGMPFAGLQLAVLDDDGNEVPAGQPGEICVRGPLVMDGYWKRPDETEDAFRFGWLHTGDIGYLDADGYLFLIDRKKDMIISGGFNVYSREVEDVIASHPDVAMVAVIGVPDDRWGEAVKALVKPKAGRSVDPAKLIALVRERKGAVHAPKTVDIADELPLTAVGKPDKKAIRARYWGDRQRSIN
jgi:fatty-acyl-CoA synthase